MNWAQKLFSKNKVPSKEQFMEEEQFKSVEENNIKITDINSLLSKCSNENYQNRSEELGRKDALKGLDLKQGLELLQSEIILDFEKVEDYYREQIDLQDYTLNVQKAQGFTLAAKEREKLLANEQKSMGKAQKLKEEFKSNEGSIYDFVTKRYTYGFKSAKAEATNINYTEAVKPEDNNNQDKNLNN